MPLGKIPFINPVNKNVDQIETSNNSVDIYDGYLDELGFFNKRPGLTPFSTISGAGKIDGLFYWDEKSVTIAVSAGIVYSINAAGTASSIGSGLLADSRATFATAKISGNQILAMANGNGVFTTDGVTVTNQANAPSDTTHVAFIDKYLLANDPGTGNLFFSEVNDPTTWPALNFTEAERKPDNILAIHVQGRDVVLFGYRSIEFYYDDGATPFRRFEGGEVDTGLSSAYSVQFLPEINSWIYLDENRSLVLLQGRVPTKISSPFDRELQNLSTASDSISDIIRVNGRGWYLLTFNDDNVSFVYDYILKTWYKWGKWNSSTNDYDRFIGNYVTYNIRDKRYLVGDYTNGIIYEMKNNVYQDNSNEIRTNLRTGFLDHTTLNLKRNKRLQFRLKRGIAKNTSDEAGSIMVKYRDDDTRDFSNEFNIDMGETGDSDFIVKLYNNGIYRARQWDFSCSDNIPFIMGNVEEDYELMRF